MPSFNPTDSYSDRIRERISNNDSTAHMVNMADPSQVRGLSNKLIESAFGSSVENGQLFFSNPFEPASVSGSGTLNSQENNGGTPKESSRDWEHRREVNDDRGDREEHGHGRGKHGRHKKHSSESDIPAPTSNTADNTAVPASNPGDNNTPPASNPGDNNTPPASNPSDNNTPPASNTGDNNTPPASNTAGGEIAFYANGTPSSAEQVSATLARPVAVTTFLNQNQAEQATTAWTVSQNSAWQAANPGTPISLGVPLTLKIRQCNKQQAVPTTRNLSMSPSNWSMLAWAMRTSDSGKR